MPTCGKDVQTSINEVVSMHAERRNESGKRAQSDQHHDQRKRAVGRRGRVSRLFGSEGPLYRPRRLISTIAPVKVRSAQQGG